MPPPRSHLARFHGVFGPHTQHRARIVPKARVADPLTTEEAAPIAPKSAAPSPNMPQDSALPSPKPPRGPYRLAWATLLRRVFAIDVLHCDRRGERRRLVALIQTPKLAEKILGHMGLSTKAPATLPARAPPQAPEQLGLFAQDGIDPIPQSWHD